MLAGGLVAVYLAGRAIAGVRLVVVAITSANLGPFRPEDRLFIPVAGLGLIFVSGKEIVEVIADRAFNRSL